MIALSDYKRDYLINTPDKIFNVANLHLTYIENYSEKTFQKQKYVKSKCADSVEF